MIDCSLGENKRLIYLFIFNKKRHQTLWTVKYTRIKYYLYKEIKQTITTEWKIPSSTSFADLYPKAAKKSTVGSFSPDDKVVWNHQDQIKGTTQGQEERKDCFTHTCQNTLWKGMAYDHIFLFLSLFLLSGQDKCLKEDQIQRDNSGVFVTDS